MFEPSRIPTGVFGQLGVGANAFSQSMGAWAPMIQQMMQYKVQQQYAPIQAAYQQLELYKSMYPTRPELWRPAMEHFQQVAKSSGLPGYKDFAWPTEEVPSAPGAPTQPTPSTNPIERMGGAPQPTTGAPFETMFRRAQNITDLPGAPTSTQAPFAAPSAAPAPTAPKGPATSPFERAGLAGQPTTPTPLTTTTQIATPGVPWENMTTAQMFPDKAMQAKIVQTAGTNMVLQMPYTEALKEFPRLQWLRAGQNAATLADMATNMGAKLDPGQMAFLKSIPMDTASLLGPDGQPDPIKAGNVIQTLVTQGQESAQRALQMQIGTEQLKALQATGSREAITDLRDRAIRAYGAAMRMGDTGAAEKIIATLDPRLAAGGVTAADIRTAGEAYRADLEAKNVYQVTGVDGRPYTVVGGTAAAAAALEKANYELRQKEFKITESQQQMLQTRFGWERYNMGQKALAALQQSEKLTNADLQVLMQLRGLETQTITRMPPAAQKALINRAVQIMRTKMGMDITVEDLTGATQPGATKKTGIGADLANYVNNLWDWAIRRRFGTVPGVTPPANDPTLPASIPEAPDETPALPTPKKPLTQGAISTYQKWVMDQKPVPASVMKLLKQHDPEGYNYLITVLGVTVDEKR